jgi:hypothetical protein
LDKFMDYKPLFLSLTTFVGVFHGPALGRQTGPKLVTTQSFDIFEVGRPAKVAATAGQPNKLMNTYASRL